MTSCVCDNLEELIQKAQENIKTIKKSGNEKTKTVAIFDLVDSTALKIKQGHDKTIEKMIQHNQVCRKFIEHFGGNTIKELGDGVLAQFDDSENACICAINFREAAKKLDIQTKIAISSGKVEILDIESKPDIFGSVIDFCARMEKFAFPNQILIDNITHDSIQSFLKNYEDLEISKPMNAVLKGHSGKKELFEISNSVIGLKNLLNIPFQVIEEGRLPIDDKVSFILNAKYDVVELGIRLREFTSYFRSRNPAEFKNYVMDLLEKGVNLRCYALDSDWALANLHIKDDELDYYKKIPETLNELLDFADEIAKIGSKGKVQVFTYQRQPLYHVQCTDGETEEGRMTVSNYLYDIKRSQCPVLQFSKQTNPVMYETYWKSISQIIASSKPWKRKS